LISVSVVICVYPYCIMWWLMCWFFNKSYN